jgi:hypothetical protein
MNADQIHSIGCGPIGAVISAIIASTVFHWQVRHWSRWIPSKCGEKGKNQLLKEYKNTNRIAKVFGLAGLFTGLLFYKAHWISDHDLRGLGVGAGLACVLPVSYIVAANIMHGTERIKEAMVAFVIDQKTPPKVLFIFMGLCFIGGVASVVSLVLRPL